MTLIEEYKALKRAHFILSKEKSSLATPSLLKLLWKSIVVNKWDVAFKFADAPYKYASVFIAIIEKDKAEKVAIIHHFMVNIDDYQAMTTELTVLLNNLFMAVKKEGYNHLVFHTVETKDLETFLLKNNFKNSSILNLILKSKYNTSGTYLTKNVDTNE
jgi:hypothetical protein